MDNMTGNEEGTRIIVRNEIKFIVCCSGQKAQIAASNSGQAYSILVPYVCVKFPNPYMI